MPKALSAIVNSHPFATRRSSQQQPQVESPPPAEGADSYYGVRSIQSSVSWSSDSSDSTALASRQPAQARSSAMTVNDEPHTHAARDLTSVTDVQDEDTADNVDSTESSDTSDSEGHESTPDASAALHASERQERPPRTSTTPTSAEPHENPVQALAQAQAQAHIVHAGAVLTRERSRSVDRPPLNHTLFDMLQDAPSASEPSSPASLASLPSCTASLSSLSRLSSPADWDQRHAMARSIASNASNAGERQDLVLPTLALPNTSLHLGLERWAGEGAGTRIALVASPERTREVIAVIAGHRKCVQLAHGEVGIVARTNTGYGELEATIITGLSPNDIARRVHDSYALLHSLLNPSPDPERRAEMAKIVTAHSIVADWIHLAFVLEDEGDLAVLDLVPVTTPADARRANVDETPRWSATNMEPWQFDTDLPRVPEHRSSAYSSPQSLSATSSSEDPSSSEEEAEEEEPGEPTPPSTPDVVRQAAAQLEAALEDRRVRVDSVSAFLDWHPESPEASTLVAEPQPTVAHAGGEWEATLSRRLAARRELDLAAARRRSLSSSTARGTVRGQTGRGLAGRGQGGRRLHRRKSTSPPPPCGPSGPLFPRRSGPGPLATSFVGLFESVFAPVKRAWRSPWAMVACAALAVAVGCGIWAARAS